VMRGEPARVFLGGVDGAAGGRDVGGESEFVGTEHFRIRKQGLKPPSLVRFNVAAKAAAHKLLATQNLQQESGLRFRNTYDEM
jgi:hypothetical protein